MAIWKTLAHKAEGIKSIPDLGCVHSRGVGTGTYNAAVTHLCSPASAVIIAVGVMWLTFPDCPLSSFHSSPR